MNKLGILELKDLSKTVKQKKILSNINFSINQGDVIALKGANGAGKSSLLNVLAGLSTFSKGQRLLADTSLVIGYVHDQFPRTILTPREILKYMGGTSGITSSEINEELLYLSKSLKIDQYLDTPTLHFSKGMMQKVNIIQALIGKPNFLLLDEPLAGLDIDSQLEFIQLIHQAVQSGTSVVITSHEGYILQQLCNRLVELDAGKITRMDSMNNKTDVIFTKILFQLDDSNILSSYSFEFLEKRSDNRFYGIINNKNREKLISDIIQKNGLILKVE